MYCGEQGEEVEEERGRREGVERGREWKVKEEWRS